MVLAKGLRVEENPIDDDDKRDVVGFVVTVYGARWLRAVEVG